MYFYLQITDTENHTLTTMRFQRPFFFHKHCHHPSFDHARYPCWWMDISWNILIDCWINLSSWLIEVWTSEVLRTVLYYCVLHTKDMEERDMEHKGHGVEASSVASSINHIVYLKKFQLTTSHTLWIRLIINHSSHSYQYHHKLHFDSCIMYCQVNWKSLHHTKGDTR